MLNFGFSLQDNSKTDRFSLSHVKATEKSESETLGDKVNEVTLPPWLLCLCHSAFYGDPEAFNWLS